MKACDLRTMYKVVGGKVTEVGRYCKWKNVCNGRLQIKIDIYKCENETGIFYVMIDTLDRVMSSFETELDDLTNWLKEKDYKTEKRIFYSGFRLF